MYHLSSLFTGLKFLVRLCTDLGLKETQDYANKLKKAEKSQKLREEVYKSIVLIEKMSFLGAHIY